MLKKAGWIYVAIYTVAILYLNIVSVISPGAGGFGWNTILSLLLLLLPAGVVAFEMTGKKVPLIVLLIPLLLMAFFFLGVIKFNTPSFETVAKGMLFGIMLLWLGLLCYKRIFRK